MTEATESNESGSSQGCAEEECAAIHITKDRLRDLEKKRKKALTGDGLFLMSPNLFHKLSEIF